MTPWRPLLLGLLLFVPFSRSHAQRSGVTDTRFDPVRREVLQGLANRTAAAAVGLIARDDSILFLEAVGAIEPGAPMPVDRVRLLWVGVRGLAPSSRR